MMTSYTQILVLCVVLHNLGLTGAVLPANLLDGVHQKFEFQNSFKPPLLVNARGQIPFWERSGDALATEEQVRICPSMQDRYGAVWNNEKYGEKHWMVDVTFKISGRNTYGADGIAFWFTKEKGSFGRLFGNKENFDGLGIIVDTFDNNGNGDTPKVAIYTSDGSLRYNFATDGTGQDKGHCLKEIRNRKQPVKLKIINLRQSVQVWIHDGASTMDDDYDLCAQAHDINLPSEGHFGVSAATGGLSDDHDVLSFLVHTLTPINELREKRMLELDAARQQELQDQYLKMSHTFQEKREQYNKNHPRPGADMQDKLEMEDTIRMIQSTQLALLQDVRQMSNKLSKLEVTGGTGNQGGGGGNSELLKQMESRLSHQITEMKGTSGGSGKIDSQQMQPIYEMKNSIKELKQNLEELRHDIHKLGAKTCPSGGSGVTTSYFTVFMLIQWVTIIGFLVLKHTQERNAKKFF